MTSSASYQAQIVATLWRRWADARVRPLAARDCAVVMRDLVPVLSAWYPAADKWLARRLDDVVDGHATCEIARDRKGLLAVAIQTPKGRRCSKLSTIWVAERARHRGFGAALLDRRRRQWIRDELDETWVTASRDIASTLEPLLLPRGFRIAAVELDRYGTGRDEIVYRWRPTQDAMLQRAALEPFRLSLDFDSAVLSGATA